MNGDLQSRVLKVDRNVLVVDARQRRILHAFVDVVRIGNADCVDVAGEDIPG